MLDSLAQFNKEIDNFAKNIAPSEVVKLQKKIVLEALKKIVQKTPVDTGRARGNWQTSIGSPIESAIERLEPKGNEPQIEAGTAETIVAGLSAITSLPPYSIVWISNNMNYIEFLEGGSSKQAPAGMVMLTVEELRVMFEKEVV
jgi:hypothetical protein